MKKPIRVSVTLLTTLALIGPSLALAGGPAGQTGGKGGSGGSSGGSGDKSSASWYDGYRNGFNIPVFKINVKTLGPVSTADANNAGYDAKWEPTKGQFGKGQKAAGRKPGKAVGQDLELCEGARAALQQLYLSQADWVESAQSDSFWAASTPKGVKSNDSYTNLRSFKLYDETAGVTVEYPATPACYEFARSKMTFHMQNQEYQCGLPHKFQKQINWLGIGDKSEKNAERAALAPFYRKMSAADAKKYKIHPESCAPLAPQTADLNGRAFSNGQAAPVVVSGLAGKKPVAPTFAANTNALTAGGNQSLGSLITAPTQPAAQPAVNTAGTTGISNSDVLVTNDKTKPAAAPLVDKVGSSVSSSTPLIAPAVGTAPAAPSIAEKTPSLKNDGRGDHQSVVADKSSTQPLDDGSTVLEDGKNGPDSSGTMEGVAKDESGQPIVNNATTPATDKASDPKKSAKAPKSAKGPKGSKDPSCWAQTTLVGLKPSESEENLAKIAKFMGQITDYGKDWLNTSDRCTNANKILHSNVILANENQADPKFVYQPTASLIAPAKTSDVSALVDDKNHS